MKNYLTEKSPDKTAREGFVQGDPLQPILRRMDLSNEKHLKKLGVILASDVQRPVLLYIGSMGATCWAEILATLGTDKSTLVNALRAINEIVSIKHAQPYWKAKKGRGSPHDIFYLEGTPPDVVADATVRLQQLLSGIEPGELVETDGLVQTILTKSHRGSIRWDAVTSIMKDDGLTPDRYATVYKSLQPLLNARGIHVDF